MVDIIIPIYNSKGTIRDALNSLLCQTKKMFIVTIVNDADGQDYSDIINEYRDKGLMIKYLELSKNSGPGVARQFGMDNDTQSAYFMFLDSDDMLFPYSVEFLSEEIQTRDLDIVMGTNIAEKLHGIDREFQATTSPVQWCGGKIYRAQYLRDNDIRFRTDLRLNEDSYFNLVAFNCTENLIRLDKPVYYWRDNPNSLTRKDYDHYFEQGWLQYLQSQVYGLTKVLQTNPEPNSLFVAGTFYNMYSFIMKAVRKAFDISIVDSLYKILNSMPQLDKILADKDFWLSINARVEIGEFNDEELWVYPMSFIDWFDYMRNCR